jgi:hypothetical protein
VFVSESDVADGVDKASGNDNVFHCSRGGTPHDVIHGAEHATGVLKRESRRAINSGFCDLGVD